MKEKAEKISSFLKLKTLPLGVSFLKEGEELPERVKRPRDRGIQITLCQAMTWARLYAWRVAVEKEDNLCIPGGLALNLLRSRTLSNTQALSRFMVEVGWVEEEKAGEQEWYVIEETYSTLLLEPLSKATREPHLVVIYGDPSQVAKLIQGYAYSTGKSLLTRISGRVACSEYLVAPYKLQAPVVTIPGTGDRVFSGTQDTEMVFSVPYPLLEAVVTGMEKAGARVGSNRYPFPPYMLHQAQFPGIYAELARKMDIPL